MSLARQQVHILAAQKGNRTDSGARTDVKLVWYTPLPLFLLKKNCFFDSCADFPFSLFIIYLRKVFAKFYICSSAKVRNKCRASFASPICFPIVMRCVAKSTGTYFSLKTYSIHLFGSRVVAMNWWIFFCVDIIKILNKFYKQHCWIAPFYLNIVLCQV